MPTATYTTPVAPTFSNAISTSAISSIATYMTTGFWTATGDTPGKFNVRAGGALTVNLTGLTAEGQALALQALDSWTRASGINFTQVTTGGQITFDDTEDGAFATSVKSNGIITSSHVNISTGWLDTYGTDVAGYSLQTYIHEIGHALGLGHPGNYNGTATYGRSNAYVEDSWQMTIMSYFSQTQNRTTGGSFAWVLSPQLADLRAIEALYGANARAGAGNTTYGVGSNAGVVHQAIAEMLADGVLASPISFTIMDRSGVDLLDLSTDVAAQSINLTGGTTSNVYGLRGNLIIEGNTVIENLRAGLGNDSIRGNAVNNAIWAGAGNDAAEGGAGNDSIDGGAGADTLWGGLGNDNLSGGDGADFLTGEAGNDVLNGGAEVDTLVGGLGNDTLTGGDGVDVFDAGEGNDVINGDAGAESIAGGLGNDKVYGGADRDTLLGEAGNDSLYGGTEEDVLNGDLANDNLYGGDAYDILYGGDGNDALYGENEGDVLIAGLGNDRLYGGAGEDTLYGGLAYDADDTLGNDLLDGGADRDILIGEGGNDTLLGGAGEDLMIGGDGNDRLIGDLNADTLFGDAGNDVLNGGADNDVVFGHEGNDVLTGGTGADLFVMYWGETDASVDKVTDFVSGTDQILISTMGNFSMIGSQAFSGTAGELRHVVSRAGITVQYDADGDGTSDANFLLAKATTLTASDFNEDYSWF